MINDYGKEELCSKCKSDYLKVYECPKKTDRRYLRTSQLHMNPKDCVDCRWKADHIHNING
jgi:hypothetical protein